ncbi:hypothetical protein H4R35_003480 [Dimargaris xerosporica]|nr:hypothetical protein H4R35_003480 [Dimargaris xerosporica]
MASVKNGPLAGPLETVVETIRALRFTALAELTMALAETRPESLLQTVQDLVCQLQVPLDATAEIKQAHTRVLFGYLSAVPDAIDFVRLWETQQATPLIEGLEIWLVRLFDRVLQLTCHSEYHSVGQTIAEALLEQQLGALRSYVADPWKPVCQPTLSLLGSLASYSNTVARTLAQRYHFDLRLVQHWLHTRSPPKPLQSDAIDLAVVGYAEQDVRATAVRFLLAFFRGGDQTTKETMLCKRGLYQLIFEGLARDSYLQLLTTLAVLHDAIVCDTSLRRHIVGKLFIPSVVRHLGHLYHRRDTAQVHYRILPHLFPDATAWAELATAPWSSPMLPQEITHEAVNNPATTFSDSSAAVVDRFMTRLCATPGTGLCFYDRGWYGSDASTERSDAEKPEAPSSNSLTDTGLSSVHVPRGYADSRFVNRQLALIVVLSLAPTDSLGQQRLLLRILRASPELSEAYWKAHPITLGTGSNLYYLAQLGLALKTIDIPNPHDISAAALATMTPLEKTRAGKLLAPSLLVNPPPVRAMVESILPLGLNAKLFGKVLSSSSPFIVYTTTVVLAKALSKLQQVAAFMDGKMTAQLPGASTTSTMVDVEAWQTAKRQLLAEIKRRLPSFNTLVDWHGVLAHELKPSDSGAGHRIVYSAFVERHALTHEVLLKVIKCYRSLFPEATFRFDYGKLLPSLPELKEYAQQAISATNALAQRRAIIAARSICHVLGVLHNVPEFQWWTTFRVELGTNAPSQTTTHEDRNQTITYLSVLIMISYLSPYHKVRAMARNLVHRFVRQSVLFVHSATEAFAWYRAVETTLDTLLRSPEFPDNTSQYDKSTSLPMFHRWLQHEQVVVYLLAFMDRAITRCLHAPHRHLDTMTRMNHDVGSALQAAADAALTKSSSSNPSTNAAAASDERAILAVLCNQNGLAVPSTATQQFSALLFSFVQMAKNEVGMYLGLFFPHLQARMAKSSRTTTLPPTAAQYIVDLACNVLLELVRVNPTHIHLFAVWSWLSGQLVDDVLSGIGHEPPTTLVAKLVQMTKLAKDDPTQWSPWDRVYDCWVYLRSLVPLAAAHAICPDAASVPAVTLRPAKASAIGHHHLEALRDLDYMTLRQRVDALVPWCAFQALAQDSAGPAANQIIPNQARFTLVAQYLVRHAPCRPDEMAELAKLWEGMPLTALKALTSNTAPAALELWCTILLSDYQYADPAGQTLLHAALWQQCTALTAKSPISTEHSATVITMVNALLDGYQRSLLAPAATSGTDSNCSIHRFLFDLLATLVDATMCIETTRTGSAGTGSILESVTDAVEGQHPLVLLTRALLSHPAFQVACQRIAHQDWDFASVSPICAMLRRLVGGLRRVSTVRGVDAIDHALWRPYKDLAFRQLRRFMVNTVMTASKTALSQSGLATAHRATVLATALFDCLIDLYDGSERATVAVTLTTDWALAPVTAIGSHPITAQLAQQVASFLDPQHDQTESFVRQIQIDQILGFALTAWHQQATKDLDVLLIRVMACYVPAVPFPSVVEPFVDPHQVNASLFTTLAQAKYGHQYRPLPAVFDSAAFFTHGMSHLTLLWARCLGQLILGHKETRQQWAKWVIGLPQTFEDVLRSNHLVLQTDATDKANEAHAMLSLLYCYLYCVTTITTDVPMAFAPPCLKWATFATTVDQDAMAVLCDRALPILVAQLRAICTTPGEALDSPVYQLIRATVLRLVQALRLCSRTERARLAAPLAQQIQGLVYGMPVATGNTVTYYGVALRDVYDLVIFYHAAVHEVPLDSIAATLIHHFTAVLAEFRSHQAAPDSNQPTWLHGLFTALDTLVVVIRPLLAFPPITMALTQLCSAVLEQPALLQQSVPMLTLLHSYRNLQLDARVVLNLLDTLYASLYALARNYCQQLGWDVCQRNDEAAMSRMAPYIPCDACFLFLYQLWQSLPVDDWCRSHLHALLPYFTATLSLKDQIISTMLLQYERHRQTSVLLDLMLWGPMAVNVCWSTEQIATWPSPVLPPKTSTTRADIRKTLDCLDRATMLRTIRQYPVTRSLERSHVWSEYQWETGAFAEPTESAIVALPTSAHRVEQALRAQSQLDHSTYKLLVAKTEHSQMYDPAFILPLTAALIQLGGVPMVVPLLGSNALGMAMMALSSEHQTTRRAGYLILEDFYSLLLQSQFFARTESRLIFNLLWCSLARLPKDSSQLPRISSHSAVWLAEALACAFTPADVMYPRTFGLVIERPAVNLQDIPQFYEAFQDTSDHARRERQWALHMLEAGLRCSDDFEPFRRRYMFDLISAFYNSPLAKVTAKKSILATVLRVVQHPSVLHTMLYKSGLLPWLHQQLVTVAWDPTMDIPLALIRLVRLVALNSNPQAFQHSASDWYATMLALGRTVVQRIIHALRTRPLADNTQAWYITAVFEVHRLLYFMHQWRITQLVLAESAVASEYPIIAVDTLLLLQQLISKFEAFYTTAELQARLSTPTAQWSPMPPDGLKVTIAILTRSTNCQNLFAPASDDGHVLYQCTVYMFTQLVGQLTAHQLPTAQTGKEVTMDKRCASLAQFAHRRSLLCRYRDETNSCLAALQSL